MASAGLPPSVDRYLDLIGRVLTREFLLDPRTDPTGELYAACAEGRGWPVAAETMVGTARLTQLRDAVLTVITDGVPGDVLEAGAWRGGATIMMRAVIAAMGDPRRVWVADSFEGLPPPDAARFPLDANLDLSPYAQLAVSLEEVEHNFARFGLLDDQVVFLKGLFKDTLAIAPVDRLALLRLDGDLYESTWQTLEALYPKISPGGFCIVDDYGRYEQARQATEDYRALHGITDPIITVDWTGVYWRRSIRDLGSP